MIREAEKNDLKSLLELYLYLHENNIPDLDGKVRKVWEDIINDPSSYYANKKSKK